MVEEYTRRNMTYEEDQMVALAGVVSRFAEAQGGKDECTLLAYGD